MGASNTDLSHHPSSTFPSEALSLSLSLSLCKWFPVLRLQFALLVPRIHEMCGALSSREVASWLSMPVSSAVTRLGLAGSLGWVRLILDRFRDAVCTHPDSSTPIVNLKNDEFNFESLDSQRRGGGGFRNALMVERARALALASLLNASA